MRIGIQKSGRLRQCSEEYFAELGLKPNEGQTGLLQLCTGDVQFAYGRQADLPKLLEQGVLEAAIVGQNILVERPTTCEVLTELDCAVCELAIAAPKGKSLKLKDLEGKKIATSYPNSLRKFLVANKINAETVQLAGSVEIAPALGIADAICDLVQSGKTLNENDLKSIATIYKSRAVLIISPYIKPSSRKLLEKNWAKAKELI